MSGSQEPVLPNFLIVGFMKCGTASLASYLGEHTDIFMARGEIHFFSDKRKWEAGKEWYSQFFRECNQEKMIGERTPAYTQRPDANPPVPERIKLLLPCVKLTWCMRDPVDRAYSHYWHFVRTGRESLSFEKALEKRQEPGTKPWCNYREGGIYINQIKLYLRYFPIEQMFFVILEEMKRNPHQVVQRLFEFLGVDPSLKVKGIGIIRNQGGMSRSKLTQMAVNRIFGERRNQFRKLIQKINTRSGYPPMNPTTRKALEEFYRPCNEELAKLTGINISDWQ